MKKKVCSYSKNPNALVGDCSADGKPVHKVPLTYGYGEQYVQSAGEWLHKQGLIKLARYSNGGGEMLWTYCKNKGITFYHSVSDGLKRDL